MIAFAFFILLSALDTHRVQSRDCTTIEFDNQLMPCLFLVSSAFCNKVYSVTLPSPKDIS